MPGAPQFFGEAVRIKQEHKVITISFLGGVCLWIGDALLENLERLHQVSFINILFYDPPSYSYLLRPIFLISFTLFGFLIASYMKKEKQSEGRYRYLFDSINDIVMVRPFIQQSVREKFIEANPLASKKLGYTREELLQLTPADLIEPDRLPNFAAVTSRLHLGGHAIFETAWLTKEGRPIHLEVNSHVIDFNGTPSILCIARDITERKQREEEIARLASFPQLNPNPILEVDASGAITYCNDATREVAKKLGEHIEAFLPKDLPEILQAADRLGEIKFYRELEIKGVLFSEFIYLAPQFNVARIFPVDITEHRNAEESLRESERQLRSLASRLLEVQEEERGRITKELHDELGQSLLFLKLQMSAVMHHLRKDQEKLRQECAQILAHVDTVIDNIRRLIRDLSPASLEELGLTSAIKLLLEEFAKHYNISLGPVNFADIDQLFPAPVRLGIFRIFQEALTNIGKHAQATQVSCSCEKIDHAVLFSITDNGLGFKVTDYQTRQNGIKGIGLSTMMERARLAGGKLEIRSHNASGTEITFVIPTELGRGNESATLSNRPGG
jgi:PAS domain S-box-containing protein